MVGFGFVAFCAAIAAIVSAVTAGPAARPASAVLAPRHGSHPAVSPSTRGSAPGVGAGAVAASRRVPGPPAAEAGLYPWHLARPLSREVAVAGAAGKVILAGGLGTGDTSSAGVFSLSPSNGAEQPLASLPLATHDAAGGMVGPRLVVVGGGQAAPSATSQGLSGAAASLLGALPQARADASAVTIGSRLYVVGGYDGPAMDRDVLATSDGRQYRRVASLLVPVRYPALAAVGSQIYVLGGQDAAGRPLDAVQLVDTSSGRVRLLAPLPEAVSGAAAGTVSGVVYLAGGLTGSAHPRPTAAVWAYRPGRGQGSGAFLRAGSLPVAVANAGATVVGGRLVLVGGETAGGAPSADAQFVRPDRAFGTAGAVGAGSPYYGDLLLVADRGNNRLLVLDDTGKIVWQYPSASMPPPPGGFYFPDDAFFVRHGTAIMINQEDNETLVELAYPSGKVLWQYGHPRVAGSSAGYLDGPDDAYLLSNGDISVADPKNCRVVVINPATKQVLHQIGTPGACLHQPPTMLGSPNGDTPLADGNLLVSEINGSWIDEYTLAGRLVWTAHLAIGYPSDPQPLGGDRYLVADYEQPGGIVEFDRSGKILYDYAPASGPGELNQPSLVELLPSGVFMANDDYNDRMVAIDPATGALVWQYGITGEPGTRRGMLNTPDGFDVLLPNGTTPTHPTTG